MVNKQSLFLHKYWYRVGLFNICLRRSLPNICFWSKKVYLSKIFFAFLSTNGSTKAVVLIMFYQVLDNKVCRGIPWLKCSYSLNCSIFTSKICYHYEFFYLKKTHNKCRWYEWFGRFLYIFTLLWNLYEMIKLLSYYFSQVLLI